MTGSPDCGVRIPSIELSTFTDQPFGGNPAAVCIVNAWPTDQVMQSIARENNVSETAFILNDGPDFPLRWFSPWSEVDLCGHATIAAAYVVFQHIRRDLRSVVFLTKGGRLVVRLDDQSTYHLALPAFETTVVTDPPPDLVAGLNTPFDVVLCAEKNFYVVLADEESLRALRPDFALLRRLHPLGVSVTAPWRDVDFVSRYFAPSYGIDEDPVSGHPHCALVPYWSNVLQRNSLLARQLSDRGGDLQCLIDGGLVWISGRVAIYREGEIRLPTVFNND